MHVKTLKSVWSTAVGGDVLCTSLSRDGLQIAVGTKSGAVLFDAKTGKEVSRLKNATGIIAGPVTGAVFGDDGRIVVGCEGRVLLSSSDAQRCFIKQLDISEGLLSSVVLLSPQPDGNLIGAVSDNSRKVFILDLDLNVSSKLVVPAKYGPVSELFWLSKNAIVATAADGLHIWRHFDNETKPAMTLGPSIGLTIASASSQTSSLASSSRDGVAYIWTVEEDSNAKDYDEALSAELRSTLKEYPSQVQSMCWDKPGKYLATADGPEATIWEVPKLLKESTQSTVCTGHDASAQIVVTAFQDNGPMLATAGNDGSIMIFNSDRFQPGKHSRPIACLQSDFGETPISTLLWTPGGKLVAGTVNGKVGMWSLSQPVPPQPTLTSIPLRDSQGVPLRDSQSILLKDTQGFPLRETQGNPPRDPPRETQDLLEQASALGPGLVSARSSLGRNSVERSSLASTNTTKRAQRPAPLDARKPNPPTNGLSRQRSNSRVSGLLPKLSNQSLSDHSSSLRSPDGMEMWQQMKDSKHGGDKSHSSSLHNQASLLSAESLSDVSRSQQDSLPTGTTRSPGQGLSPSLWNSIQNVGKKRAQPNGPREPAGWGLGSATPNLQSAPLPASIPLPFSPNHAAGQMGPGGQMPQPFMMLPGQPGMPPQAFPAQPGYPAMTPFPMMPSPTAPQGMVDVNGMPAYTPMMYMPVPQGLPQAPWPGAMQGGMMPGPWMAPYMMHPSHQGMQKHVGVAPVARAFSVPEDQMQVYWPNQGKADSKKPGSKQADDAAELSSTSISLPYIVSQEWKAKMKESGSKDAKDNEPSRGETGRKSGHMSDLREEPGEGEEAAGRGDLRLENDTIYVGNLAQAVTEQQLAHVFGKYGQITHTQVIRDKVSQVSRGFGFVSFSSSQAATDAIKAVNGQKLYGMFNSRSLKVSTSNRPAQSR